MTTSDRPTGPTDPRSAYNSGATPVAEAGIGATVLELSCSAPEVSKHSVWSSSVLELARLVTENGVVALGDYISKLSTRRLRELVGTSETTFFRHVSSKSALVEGCYNECWRYVVLCVAQRGFVPARIITDAADLIQDDFELLAELVLDRRDDRVAAMVTCAFYMYERAEALGLEQDSSPHARLFERRLMALCRLAGYEDADEFAHSMIGMFVRYLAIWNMSRDDPELCSIDGFRKRLHDELHTHARARGNEIDLRSSGPAEQGAPDSPRVSRE